MSTLFEKIIARDIPAEILYEDKSCIAIKDIEPQAPVHFLVIPKKVIARLGEAVKSDQSSLGHLLITAAQVARELGLEEGYRTVINSGTHGGETVPHLHVHVLGGRQLKWPPG
jgi:histidine triad (HIT) family protein